MSATFYHLLIYDMRKTWGWILPSGIKQIYQHFNWRFWKDDSMRDELVKDEALDPHYKEMFRVNAFDAFSLS